MRSLQWRDFSSTNCSSRKERYHGEEKGQEEGCEEIDEDPRKAGFRYEINLTDDEAKNQSRVSQTPQAGSADEGGGKAVGD